MNDTPNLTSLRCAIRREVDSFFTPLTVFTTAAIAVILGICLLTLVR